MTELVSIVVPARNAGSVIGQTIESVRAQTFTNWELIVIDHGSVDDTGRVVDRHSRQDSRIRVISNANGQGPGAPRNVGLRAAKGRFVAFLDADDLWLPRKLERQVEFMMKTGVALSYTQFRRIREQPVRLGRLINVPERLDFVGLMKNTAIATSTVMIDRDQMGPVYFSLGLRCDDYTLYLKILRAGHVAGGLREDLVRYRVTKGSISRNKAIYALEVWRLYRDYAGIGLASAAWYYAHYVLRGVLKYARF